MATALLLAASAACQHRPNATTPRKGLLEPAAATDAAHLVGRGSTFVEPLLRQWLARYQGVAPHVAIDYEGVGSGTGLASFRAGDGQFATSDVPLSEVDEATLGGSESFVQTPWAAGAIGIVYNLADVGQLRLSPATMSGIFGGRIQRWDEPEVRADNPDVKLPSLPIQVVFRSDGSGTTQVFSSYLQETAGWDLGAGLTARFPRGQGARGSDGVISAVKRISGAIGYVGLSYARRASAPVALLGNRSNQFVAPTPGAVSAALAGATLRPNGTTARLYFLPEAPGAYPLATVSYLIFRRGLEPAAATALRHFAAWALTEGQRDAEGLGYVALPRTLANVSLNAVQQY